MESATRLFESLRSACEWSLLTTRDLPRTERWRQGGARVKVSFFDEARSRLVRRMRGLLWSGRIGKEIAAFSPDVVHFNDIQSYNAYSYVPPRLRKRPIVFTLRGMRPPEETFAPIWNRLAAEAAAIVVLSDEMGSSLVRAVPEFAGKVRTIHSIVDLNALSPPSPAERARIREDLGIGTDEYAIGCIGAIREKKGQLELLQQLVPELSTRLPSAKIHFLGDADAKANPFCGRFRAAAERLAGSDSFRIEGHVHDLARWYAALDLVVIPSETEGLSRAMIEAMGAGLPVVSTAVCSATEMLDQTGAGRVVPIGDFGAMLQAIVDFAEDANRLEAGEAGRRLALARFQERAVAEQWLSLYEHVAKSQK